jgi:hypothetical protein
MPPRGGRQGPYLSVSTTTRTSSAAVESARALDLEAILDEALAENLYPDFTPDSTFTPRPYFRSHRISRKIHYATFSPTRNLGSGQRDYGS